MIDMTLGQASRALEVVHRLAQFRFPYGQQKAAYDLSKARRLLLAEVAHFESERKKLIQECGVKRDATQQELRQGAEPDIYEVPQGSERWLEFVARINELVGVSITLDCAPLNLVAVDLSADDIDALGPLLAEPT